MAVFEKPASPVGYFTTYSPGQKIGPWLVVGNSGYVATEAKTTLLS